ncbi:hypothetical protein T11_11386, partial [Trichinella zimbabwensis]
LLSELLLLLCFQIVSLAMSEQSKDMKAISDELLNKHYLVFYFVVVMVVAFLERISETT